jgi:hypothetical protein
MSGLLKNQKHLRSQFILATSFASLPVTWLDLATCSSLTRAAPKMEATAAMGRRRAQTAPR